MKLLPALAALFVLFSCSTATVRAQTQALDDANTVAMLKANYLFNFSKHSDWPSDKKQGKFVIGVLGDDDIFEELVDRYATKNIGSQVLEIVNITEPYDLSEVHVVYIAPSHLNKTADVVAASSESNTMVITDLASRLQAGTVFNFKIADNRIQFEVDLEEAEERGIIIGEKIKSWAYNKQ